MRGSPEQWVAIKGYEGLYAVSDHGNVMSMNYAKSGLPGLMTQFNHRGYMKVYLRKKGVKAKCAQVHVLVAQAFIGERPAGRHVNHIDGKFGISGSHLSHIISGRIWPHIPFAGEVRVIQ